MSLLKKPITKRIIIIVLIAVVTLGAFLGYRAFVRMKKRSTSATSISYTVSRGSIKSTISAVGTVSSANSRNLTALAGSTVSSVNCTEGQSVKDGDTLFTLSNQSAQIDLKKAKLNLTQLQNQLSTLNSELSDLTIYAPVSGIVKSVNVNAGDSVTSQGSGQSGLIQIEDTSSMKFSLSSSAAGSDKSALDSLIPGQVVQVDFSGEGGSRQVKVISTSYSQQGSSITFQVLSTKGLSWDGYYTLSAIIVQGKSINIGIPVQVAGSLTNVNAKQSGIVTSVYVKSGSSVSKGSRLIATKSDNITSQIQSTEINIESAQLDVQNKQSAVDSLTVKAPIDGTIENIQVQIGDVVGSTSSKTSATSSASYTSSQSSSQSSQSQSVQSSSTGSGTTIASIENTSLLQVQVSVDELDISKVQVGQTATITADAVSGKTFTGKVSSIAADGTVQSGSATYQVIIDLDNSDGLKSGMTANVSILTASKDNVLLLPVEAIQERNSRKFVLVKDANGGTTMKEVTLGIVNVNYAEIVSGLNEGDTVIAQIQTSSSSSSSNSSRSGMSGMGGLGGMSRFGGTGTSNRQSGQGSYNRQNSQSNSSSNSSGN